MAETVGSLIDKIIILDLKIYHMDEQVSRKDADREHIQECTEKMRVLKVQKDDLSHELDELIDDLIKGKKKLNVYRQFKMYNDPKYNIPSG